MIDIVIFGCGYLNGLLSAPPSVIQGSGVALVMEQSVGMNGTKDLRHIA